MRIVTSLLALSGALLLGGCSAGEFSSFLDTILDESLSSTEVIPDSTVDVAAANAALSALPVRTSDSGSMSDYSGQREALFGPAWTDSAQGVALSGNGCDTRNDILARDLTNVVKDGKCKVTSGVLEEDPYTGNVINFQRGRNTSSAVQIDHVVALGDAWRAGADQITYEQRVALANDPDNLLAVDGPTNGAKSDSPADKWLPANPAALCDYAARQVIVKDRYDLTVTAPEKATLTDVLSKC